MTFFEYHDIIVNKYISIQAGILRNSNKYEKEWGNNPIAELSLNGNEEILDLGCGDGGLTGQLAQSVPNGRVLGIDRIGSILYFQMQLFIGLETMKDF